MNLTSFRTSTYLQYLSKRKSIQYIHSPFLFKLMETVFDDVPGNRPVSFQEIEFKRNRLIASKETISFEDFGAGGDKEKIKEVAIRNIAKKSLNHPKYARFLYRLIQFTKSKTIIELGTSLGITTLYLSAAVEPNGKIFTIEADKNLKKIAEDNWSFATKNNIKGVADKLRMTNSKNIECYCFDLNEKWSLFASEVGKIDFLFVDANHRKEAMIRYVLQAMPYLYEKSVVVLDDIHWSEETFEAWNILKKRPEVTLSFDIYQMGVLFFDKNLSKEDYMLKY